jgi:hypothetical protein
MCGRFKWSNAASQTRVDKEKKEKLYGPKNQGFNE